MTDLLTSSAESRLLAPAQDRAGGAPLFFDIFNSLDLGVVLLDPAAREVVALNLAAEHLLQVAGIEPVYGTLVRLFPPEPHRPPESDSEAATVQFGVTLIGYTNTEISAGMRCLAVRDVTERARLEAIAQAVNVMDNSGYVFSCVRHEIGNPLNSLKTMLSVLETNLEKYTKRTIGENIARCLTEIGRMEQLLRSLKSFSMYEHPSLETVDLPVFMDGFLRLVNQQLESRRIRVATRYDARKVYLDPRALNQVLLNLVINAMDALTDREDPRLAVISRPVEPGFVALSVSDNGAGMTPEQQRQLFRPFCSTKPHGTGLGLVIARKLLSRMNCQISIESAPGAGTIVTLTVPERPGVPARTRA